MNEIQFQSDSDSDSIGGEDAIGGYNYCGVKLLAASWNGYPTPLAGVGRKLQLSSSLVTMSELKRRDILKRQPQPVSADAGDGVKVKVDQQQGRGRPPPGGGGRTDRRVMTLKGDRSTGNGSNKNPSQLKHTGSAKRAQSEDRSRKGSKSSILSNILPFFKKRTPPEIAKGSFKSLSSAKPVATFSGDGSNGRKSLFARPLVDICDFAGNLPEPLLNLLRYLYNVGPGTVGIFRKSACSKSQQDIRHKLDDGATDIDFEHGHLAGSVLKEFLRSLPECVLSEDCVCDLIKLHDVADESLLLKQMRELIGRLPSANSALLERVVCVLYHISLRADDNMMNASNLGICVGQSLLWSASDSVLNPATAAQKVPKVIEFLIEHFADIFGVDSLLILADDQRPSLTGESENMGLLDSHDIDSLGSSLGSSLDSHVGVLVMNRERVRHSRDSGICDIDSTSIGTTLEHVLNVAASRKPLPHSKSEMQCLGDNVSSKTSTLPTSASQSSILNWQRLDQSESSVMSPASSPLDAAPPTDNWSLDSSFSSSCMMMVRQSRRMSTRSHTAGSSDSVCADEITSWQSAARHASSGDVLESTSRQRSDTNSELLSTEARKRQFLAQLPRRSSADFLGEIANDLGQQGQGHRNLVSANKIPTATVEKGAAATDSERIVSNESTDFNADNLSPELRMPVYQQVSEKAFVAPTLYQTEVQISTNNNAPAGTFSTPAKMDTIVTPAIVENTSPVATATVVTTISLSSQVQDSKVEATVPTSLAIVSSDNTIVTLSLDSFVSSSQDGRVSKETPTAVAGPEVNSSRGTEEIKSRVDVTGKDKKMSQLFEEVDRARAKRRELIAVLDQAVQKVVLRTGLNRRGADVHPATLVDMSHGSRENGEAKMKCDKRCSLPAGSQSFSGGASACVVKTTVDSRLKRATSDIHLAMASPGDNSSNKIDQSEKIFADCTNSSVKLKKLSQSAADVSLLEPEPAVAMETIEHLSADVKFIEPSPVFTASHTLVISESPAKSASISDVHQPNGSAISSPLKQRNCDASNSSVNKENTRSNIDKFKYSTSLNTKAPSHVLREHPTINGKPTQSKLNTNVDMESEKKSDAHVATQSCVKVSSTKFVFDAYPVVAMETLPGTPISKVLVTERKSRIVANDNASSNCSPSQTPLNQSAVTSLTSNSVKSPPAIKQPLIPTSLYADRIGGNKILPSTTIKSESLKKSPKSSCNIAERSEGNVCETPSSQRNSDIYTPVVAKPADASATPLSMRNREWHKLLVEEYSRPPPLVNVLVMSQSIMRPSQRGATARRPSSVVFSTPQTRQKVDLGSSGSLKTATNINSRNKVATCYANATQYSSHSNNSKSANFAGNEKVKQQSVSSSQGQVTCRKNLMDTVSASPVTPVLSSSPTFVLKSAARTDNDASNTVVNVDTSHKDCSSSSVFKTPATRNSGRKSEKITWSVAKLKNVYSQ